MVKPANFGFNEETAQNNAFQQQDGSMHPLEIAKVAGVEFNAFVKKLRAAGVNVIVVKDSRAPIKPDAVFPNNWVTFHQEGLVITYPMFSAIRRRERRSGIINDVLRAGFVSQKRYSLEYHEKLNQFLEGTGSIIFDHQNKLAYACLSPRTHAGLLKETCEIIDYEPVVFLSLDANGQEIYHTNVMMAMGETFVVICLETVRDAAERAMLEAKFKATGKTVVEITLEQMNQFAGNMLQVRNDREETILVMSSSAYHSLSDRQMKSLMKHTQLLHSDLRVIETYGGGSARCMMAEIFLPEA